MKKFSKKIAVSILTSLITLTALSASPNADSENDDYIEPEKTEITESSDNYEESSEVKANNDKAAKKNKVTVQQMVKEFFLGKEKYIFFDEINLATGTVTMGYKPRAVPVIVNPETNMAGVQTYYQTSIFNITFSEKDRQIIADSYQKYLSDFENHKLIKNKKLTTRSAYSKKGKCYLEWGTVKLMMTAYGHSKFSVGYEFKKVNDKYSPYFCIIIKQTTNEQEHVGEYSLKDTTEIQLYFTKAQAKRFIELLSKENLTEIIREYSIAKESDDYNDGYSNDSSDSYEAATPAETEKYKIIDGSKKEADTKTEETVTTQSETVSEGK